MKECEGVVSVYKADKVEHVVVSYIALQVCGKVSIRDLGPW